MSSFTKRYIVPSVIVFLAVLTAALFFRPALSFLARKQLEKVFTGSHVRIANVRFLPLKQLEFLGVEIKKQKNYELRIRKASFSYDLLSIRKGIEIEVKIDFLDAQGLRLEDALLKFDNGSKSGDLRIPWIRYNKAKIDNASAKLRLKDKILYLDALKAQVFEGNVEGAMAVNTGKNMDYEVNLNFIRLNIDRFISDFDLQERFQMTGRLGGRVYLKGMGLNINSLSGELRTDEAGGVLTITDKRFLENLARTSQQSLDILVESFKNYHYNRGVMKLGMDKGNLILDVRLEGQAGQRDLNITVHDFNLRRQI